MKCDEHVSLALLSSLRNYDTTTTTSSYASVLIDSDGTSSSGSTWSDASSQHSDDSSGSASSSDSDSCDSHCPSQQPYASLKVHSSSVQPCQVELPAELRQNPRRTCNGIATRSGCPPPLVRQGDRKVNFVDNLVGKMERLRFVWQVPMLKPL